MGRTVQNRRSRVVLLVTQTIGLFAVFYVYVVLRIRPELFYQQHPHIFLLDWDFFYGMASRPGGMADYLSAFLSSLFAWGWLGALVVTLLVAIICLATRGVVAAISGSGGEIAYLVPAVLMVMVLGQYIHPVRLCVGLGIALVGANVYFQLGGCRVALRLAAFLVGSVLMYFAAAGMYTIFACLCGCHEWSVKRRRWLGAVCVLSAAVLPYAASWWPFDLILSEAYGGLMLRRAQYWLAIPSSILKAVAIHTAPLIFSLLAAAVLAWRRRPSAESQPGTSGRNEQIDPSAGANTPGRGFLRARLEAPLAILLFMILGDLVAYDSAQRCLLEIESNSEQRRWDEVLAWAEELPFPDARACDPRILYCINRSLYFKGCLLDRMFAYPQVISAPSLALIYRDIETAASLTPRECSEILFDLGRINESERMSYEALEYCGTRPEILKRLVYIYVIKGEPEAARRFLSLLERSLVDRGWARETRKELDADPMLAGISFIAGKREMAVELDLPGGANKLETLLEGLLERDPRNRMALEYLMAHYLLTRQIDRLAANRYRFDALDYPQFPQHVEEALACYMATAGLEEPGLGSRPIRAETWQRLNEFMQLERQLKGNVPLAFAALHPDFHDTYYFSFVFGHNIPALGVGARPPE